VSELMHIKDIMPKVIQTINIRRNLVKIEATIKKEMLNADNPVIKKVAR
jgi:hypothetical protein